jgi:hypothetical protein
MKVTADRQIRTASGAHKTFFIGGGLAGANTEAIYNLLLIYLLLILKFML